MKVCGFSFIRNGVKYDYPFEEAIRSILPLCDRVIVAVGRSDDDTLAKVRAIDPKVEVLETEWDEAQRAGGRVLALETDKAFQAIPEEYDWCFYIQGDEVVHEAHYDVIQKAMQRYKYDNNVEGLLFNYRHFFGSYDYVGARYAWYRREIRIVRNNKSIYSYRDAQGFRIGPNRKLKVKLINAYIHHYGWVRKPNALQQKIEANSYIYQKKGSTGYQDALSRQVYAYEASGEPVIHYEGTHPQVMLQRIAAQNWPFVPDPTLHYASFKDLLKRTVFKLTGWFPGEYKNYQRI